MLSAATGHAQESLDGILKKYTLEPVYATNFDEPLSWVRESEIIQGGKFTGEIPAGTDWVMEGNSDAFVKDGRLHLKNGEGKSHLVFWNTREFPANFLAEWDFKHEHPAGTIIVFFSAHAPDGGSIFSAGLPARGAKFGSYTRGAILSYHSSYSATRELEEGQARGEPGGEVKLQKNCGITEGGDKGGKNNIAASSIAPIDGITDRPFHVRLAKIDNRIIMEIDGEIIYDATDENVGDLPPYGGGRLGFRHMSHSVEGSYGGLKVQAIK